ncbi:RecX family transcriptional regulator [Vibrio sp. FNV 38]|nr:RecX family transcriptional regulator [Vibrio sp. FNV 38]
MMEVLESKNYKQEQKKPFQAKSVDNVMNSAMYHLGQRDMTISELTKKLENKTENSLWIEETIAKCKYLGYLKSDEDFASLYSESCLRNDYGSQYIKRKLADKGIPFPLIARCIETVLHEHAIEEKNLIRNRIERFSDLTQTNREKLVNGLVNKGFSVADINAVLNERGDVNDLKTKAQIKGAKADLESEILKLARKGKGERHIKQALRQKHICIVPFEDAVERLVMAGDVDFYEIACTALEKKRFDLTSREGSNKAYAFLNTRGFSGDQIKNAISELKQAAA